MNTRPRIAPDTRTRIALFLPDLTEGGAERIMLNLARELAEGEGAETALAVDLVVAQAVGPYVQQVAPCVRLVDLKASGTLASLPQLARYLRRERPVALLSALDRANVTAVWARKLAGVSTRIVISIHNTMSVERSHATHLKAKLMPAFAKRSYPLADAIVTVSNGAAEDLARTLAMPRDRIQVIYNPVVNPAMLAASREPLNHPWFGRGGPPVLLATGRMQPQKDYPTLLHAFAKIQKGSARLLILGDGPDRPRITCLVRELGLEDSVAMPGFVDNPYPFMAHAAAFVLSSQWEGLPTVLIEALACGTPILSTDCPNGPREILEGGRYGRLVPVGDVDALAEAMRAVLANPPAPPPPESWGRFRVCTAAAAYASLLLGKEGAPCKG